MSAYVGIDLGTTFSAVAAINRDGKPEVVLNRVGRPITPSVIYFGQEPPLVGDEAKEMSRLGDGLVAAFFKREMGNEGWRLEIKGKSYSAEDLSALLLGSLKEQAEARLGEKVQEAVITVPAYFEDARRQATMRAGQRAGLEVVGIINEPTAAALAFGMAQGTQTRHVLVYDLGGGTFDVTLLRVTPESIEVEGTDGDHHLGGKDWDDAIIQYLAAEFREKHGIDPVEDPAVLYDMLALAEKAKKELSARESTRLGLRCQGKQLTCELTRRSFEDLTVSLMERTQTLTEQVLTDARIAWTGLDGVLLVGGSTRMPMVERYVAAMSGKPGLHGVNVDEAVALGAAIKAACILKERRRLGQRRFLAAGAAKTIKDVMSHSLGMVAVAADGTKYVNSIIIRRNRTIPCEETRPFELATRAGGDNVLEVYMTQGESETPQECTVLGKYVWRGVPHSATGKAALDVSYSYDSDGIAHVRARDKASGQSKDLAQEPLPEDMAWLGRPPEKAGPGQATVYLAIDLSGSMRGGPLSEAKRAANNFVKQFNLKSVEVGLISFANTTQVNLTACREADAIQAGIEGWHVGDVGHGNLTHPFSTAFDLMAEGRQPAQDGLVPTTRSPRAAQAESLRYLIVLTDGAWCHQDAAVGAAIRCHEAGIRVIAVGFGTAKREFLKRIATSAEGSILTDLSGLSGALSSIAQVVSQGGTGLTIRK